MSKTRNKKTVDELSDSETDNISLDSDSEDISEESEDSELSSNKQVDNIDDEVEDEDDLGDEIEIDDEDRKISDNEEDCLYEHVEDTEDLVDDVYDDDEDENKSTNIVSSNERITKPFMTKYERVRLIGDRTKQLSLGAKPMIKNIEHLTSKQIAELELKHDVIPLIIERPIPNGKIERWYTKDFVKK